MSSSSTAIDVNADPDVESKFKFKSDYDFEDLASKLARQLSMILVGIIILSSIRVVLRGVTRVCIFFSLLFHFLFEYGLHKVLS